MLIHLDRMKKLSKLSGVPLQRILKFQKRESANGKLLSGDGGMSGGDLHLYKKTAKDIAKAMGDTKLLNRIKGLSTKPNLRKGWSEYSEFLIINPKIQDKLLVWLLKDTKRMAEEFVRKEFDREPEDHEHYAFWNASPDTAKKGVKFGFKSKDPKLKTLQKNIKGFLKQKKSYLQDRDDINVDEKYKIPTTRSKIAAWMKKYGWKSKDIGKMVDNKWVGYHPGDIMAQPEKEKSPPKEQITETAKVTVTDKDLKHFDDRPEDVDQKTQAPELHPAMEAQKQRQLSLEGSAIPMKNEDIELKKQEQIEEYVPSHTPMESLPEEMKVKESMEEEVLDPKDLIVDYKNRQVQKFEEGGSVLKEPQLPEDPEEQKRAMGETDIISEAIEDKVEGTVPTPVPQDAWRLKPEETVVQQEVGDLTTKSDKQIKKELKETIEVKSAPGSDVISISPRKSQVQRSKALKDELKRRKQASDDASEAAVKAGIRETKSIMAKPEVKVDLKEDVKVEETGDPKAFDLQTYIQQTLQRDDEAREVMRNELSKANESELNIQKVEPFRFWNNMSTPAKIVAGIGMLIGGYAAKDSPAGLQAVMNVIDGAVNADIQAQKLTQEQQLVVAKEATRRAKAAVDKYKAVATSPVQKAKLMELAQALEVKKAGIAKKQQLQALKQYVMNKAREGKIHLVPPALMRMVYPKEEMKRIDTMRGDYEKERKERKIQPILSAYRRMYRLIDKKEDVSGMDDIAIVFSFMKMLDPNSVVRETEFETAANAGPRAKYFARQWNRFITGGRFTQADRKGFLKSALTLVKPALDEEKQIQRKYVSMARRYGYPSAFIIPPSTRYFDLPGTKDDAAIRKIMKEQGKTRDEAESIHYHVAGKVKKPRYVMRKGVRYPVK